MSLEGWKNEKKPKGVEAIRCLYNNYVAGATWKQLVFGCCGKRREKGRKKLMMLMKDFLLYIYMETLLMRHFAPPTTLGTEEWGALWSTTGNHG